MAMEDYFEKLFYLVLGIIYLLLNKAKNQNSKEETIPDSTLRPRSTPTSKTNTGWVGTRKNHARATQKTPRVQTPLTQTTIKKRIPSLQENNTTFPTFQHLPEKIIDRVLCRDSTWQKAVIMGEF